MSTSSVEVDRVESLDRSTVSLPVCAELCLERASSMVDGLLFDCFPIRFAGVVLFLTGSECTFKSGVSAFSVGPLIGVILEVPLALRGFMFVSCVEICSFASLRDSALLVLAAVRYCVVLFFSVELVVDVADFGVPDFDVFGCCFNVGVAVVVLIE